MSTVDGCAKSFPNDERVKDSVELLRRIPPRHFHFDDNLGSWRPSSAAFEDDEDGDPMSVYRQDVLELERADSSRVMEGHEGYALASLQAGRVRSRSQTIFSDPLPGESSHAKVCGPKPYSVRRWFANQSNWVIEPPVGPSTPR